MQKIEELLKYEQPGKYIVNDTNYNDDYEIPVLTAGQSFILGYTNEKENIFDASKEPVIIFDDFTTSVKFVDFPFKVKSSAMKILHATDECDIKYAYYLLKSLKIDTRTHKRYWISNVSQIEIPKIEVEDQKEIADILSKIESAIEIKKAEQQEIEKLKDSKFYELFGDPIKNEKNFEKSTLGKEMQFHQGTQYPVEEQIDHPKDGYTRFLRIIDYTQDSQEPRYVPNGGYLISEDKVVVVRYGATAGFIGSGLSGILANNLFTVEPIDKNKYNYKYLESFLKNKNINKIITKASSSSTMPAISHTAMKKIPILIPPINLQNKYVEIILKLEEQIKVINDEISELTNLYETKMNEYFN